MFYKQYFSKGIKYTEDLLYEKTNINSFNTVRGERHLNSNFLVWTRQAVPLSIRTHPATFNVVLDWENFKCRDYYRCLIKHKYEKPKKWVKLGEEFDLEDNHVAEVFLLPIRVSSEPYLRSFRYKVLNSILFTNDILFKIGYIPSPNCSFCRDTTETRNHVLFSCPFSHSFWMDVVATILKNISSCNCLLLRDVIIGTLKEGMDLVNYVIILGKTYLWSCRHQEIKPSCSHFKKILENRYETEKYIAFQSNRIVSFHNKWKAFEELLLCGYR